MRGARLAASGCLWCPPPLERQALRKFAHIALGFEGWRQQSINPDWQLRHDKPGIALLGFGSVLCWTMHWRSVDIERQVAGLQSWRVCCFRPNAHNSTEVRMVAAASVYVPMQPYVCSFAWLVSVFSSADRNGGTTFRLRSGRQAPNQCRTCTASQCISSSSARFCSVGFVGYFVCCWCMSVCMCFLPAGT
eukprot:SAG22_NODE_2994_length_2043_cov_1.358539_1_plen_191_part_00